MISQQYLEELAKYTEQKIAKVVLNGTIEISEFNIKEVDASTVMLQYMVPATAVSEITTIELRDITNEIISTNTVYVPISSDTVLMQTVKVKEVA
ncbi:MAG: ketopantoate hydroxymethyltransferase [Paenibacillus dendritiformis]|uniref:ketopantoate hydroxymethyltransferase n=1 Tax=uncultured Paenibacillus sp. TaxID=227322 RepID=UPI0025CE3F2E|nr:ketopantoate hydroxymethyltransferase [uncultured Paenibacillus sp.]MDU5141052.1 ketopantoate hydroxymethyltransferase [Paenibacillus dendritiformis]